MNALIPTLDLTKYLFGTPEQKYEFIQSLKTALETTGFFFLTNHGISRKVLADARKAFDRFFLELTDEQRMQYEYAQEQHQRGYTPLRIEKGEFARIADEKHFFQIGYDRDVAVKEIEGFSEVTRDLFNEFRACSRILLDVISKSLQLARRDSLVFKEGNSILRAIDYPPTESPLSDDAVATRGGNIIGMCATKHTDINIITLLEAQEEGLQLWYQEQWLPISIDPSDDLIVVNAGDMLWHLTGGRYKSGLHRVVCKKNVRRFSIPYFCHLNVHHSIVPLGHLGESDLEKFRFKTVGQYLTYRLNQIGL